MDKSGYIEDTEEKGMNPFPGRLQREEFSETLHVLEVEIRGTEKGDHVDPSNLKSPSIHYNV